MKNTIIICLPILVASFLSCNSPKNKKDIGNDLFKMKIEGYSKARTNNPKLYTPGTITEKTLVDEPYIIEQCYYNKYAPKEVSFDNPDTFKAPKAKDIHEKFYKILNAFEAQNKFGALVKYQMLIFLDSSDNILASTTF
jgi:hypothetical protein